jgi:hypothetical protein
MAALFSSTLCLRRHIVAVATVAIVVVGSVWAKGNNGPQTGSTFESPRIDVAALRSRIDVRSLPLLEVEHPF